MVPGRIVSEIDVRHLEVANGAEDVDDEDGEVAVRCKEASHLTRERNLITRHTYCPELVIGVAVVGGGFNCKQASKDSVEFSCKGE